MISSIELLSLSEYRLGQIGSGLTDYHSSAQGPAYYWQNESWSIIDGSDTAMNKFADIAKAP